MSRRVYLALGDSMSIDHYTGVPGGGAVAQFHRRLGPEWALVDRTLDGCTMPNVPTDEEGDVITLTIGGNDLLMNREAYLAEGLGRFGEEHFSLLTAVREANPDACLIVGNIYAPASPLPPRERAALDEANAMIAANVERVAALLVDIRAAFDGREEEKLCLEIEPTLAGATTVAELFADAWNRWRAAAP